MLAFYLSEKLTAMALFSIHSGAGEPVIPDLTPALVLSVLTRQNENLQFHPVQPCLPVFAPIGFMCLGDPFTPCQLPEGVVNTSLSTWA